MGLLGESAQIARTGGERKVQYVPRETPRWRSSHDDTGVAPIHSYAQPDRRRRQLNTLGKLDIYRARGIVRIHSFAQRAVNHQSTRSRAGVEQHPIHRVRPAQSRRVRFADYLKGETSQRAAGFGGKGQVVCDRRIPREHKDELAVDIAIDQLLATDGRRRIRTATEDDYVPSELRVGSQGEIPRSPPDALVGGNDRRGGLGPGHARSTGDLPGS